MTPTDFQTQCLSYIDKHNSDEFSNWFKRSWVMATIQIESAFKPTAYRYEPALGEASYGLMQTLESTARNLGLTGGVTQLYDPSTSILYGMRCHRQDWAILTVRFGRDPTLNEWTDAYNRGAHGSLLGDIDHAYVQLWDSAQELWSSFDDTLVLPIKPDLSGIVNNFEDATLKLQTALKAAGYYDGPLDSDFGPRSREALNSYKKG